MKRKKYQTPLVCMAMVWGLCGKTLAQDIIFTGPNQTIKVTQNYGEIQSIYSEWDGDTVALYYPERGLSSGFKNLKVWNTIDKKGAITFIIKVAPNSPQTIGGQVYRSDYFYSHTGDSDQSFFLEAYINIGTKADDVKDIIFFSGQSNQGLAFRDWGKGYLDFTTLDLSITYKAVGGNSTFSISKAKEIDIIPSDKATTSIAPTLNAMLHLATSNNLNQRMGELRNNPHTQGVWTRIFNGEMTSRLGLGFKSNYTSFQAGYDYKLGNTNFSDYLGVALSYTFAIPSIQSSIAYDNQFREISKPFSHSTAISLYNSYIQDNGWYNDTIAKLEYIQSLFDVINLNRNSKLSTKLGNVGLGISDEFGYRFKIGNEWYIQPQMEFGVSWLSQGESKQSYEGSFEFLKTSIAPTLFIKHRIGSSFGYNLTRFIHAKNTHLSFYLGLFYEYDYICGGDMLISTTNLSSTQDSPPRFDQHLLFDFGTNIQVHESVRVYLDFEKSFFGKTTKDYQISLGVRYSFGSNASKPISNQINTKYSIKDKSL